jgi:hypothetical protein
MIRQRYLQGTRIENVDAPDVTPAGLARMGFDAVALARYLPAGIGPQGVMNFSMYDVVHNSTRWLTPDDAGAMAARAGRQQRRRAGCAATAGAGWRWYASGARPPARRSRDLAARHLGRPSPGRDSGRGARGALDDPVEEAALEKSAKKA